ncbi:hypothetical protein GOV10_01595, partial [Candidatus Woesearchaeota archaeon]|nr:hypothetical protein [Candidatus Woesearchaeota archaeon]
MLNNILERLFRQETNPYTREDFWQFDTDWRPWEQYHPLEGLDKKLEEAKEVGGVEEAQETKKVRGRLVKKKSQLQGWEYAGKQESPEFFELDDGTCISLFSDKEVYDAHQRIDNNRTARTIENIIGVNETPAHYGVPEPQVEASDLFQKIRISRPAYEKAVTAAQVIGEGRVFTPELFLSLMRHEDAPEDLVTNVLVAHQQEVSGGLCSRSTAGGILDSDWMYEHNYKYAGWSHSHGNHNTFHSGIDDRQVRAYLNNGPCLQFKETDAKIGYTRSMVVNERGDTPFGLIGIQYWHGGDHE